MTTKSVFNYEISHIDIFNCLGLTLMRNNFVLNADRAAWSEAKKTFKNKNELKKDVLGQIQKYFFEVWNTPYGEADAYSQKLSIRKIELILPDQKSMKMFGFFAKRAIRKGEVIIEYVGQMTPKSRLDEQAEERKKNSQPENGFIFSSFVEGWDIDSERVGSLARFTNDSTNPNMEVVFYWPKRLDNWAHLTELQKDWLLDTPHIMYFAKRDIQPDEELTLSYGGEEYWGPLNITRLDLESLPKKITALKGVRHRFQSIKKTIQKKK